MNLIRIAAPLLAFALAGSPLDAGAQASAASMPSPAASAAAAIPTFEDVRVHPGPSYPAELAKDGVQGEVLVLIAFGADGRPTEASVARPSASPELDAAAIAFVKGYVKVGDKDHPPPPAIRLPVVFTKDSVRTLGEKTCADFAVDAKYFQATHPGKSLRDMPVVNMAVGALILGRTSGSRDRMLAFASHSGAPAADATAAACAAHPDDRFLATLSRVIDEATTKAR